MNFRRIPFTLVAFACAALLTVEALAAVGDIYETNEGTVLKFRPTGGTPATFAEDLANPKGIVFDGKGNLYVADAARGTIFQFDATGGRATGVAFITDLNSPIGLAFDLAGNLYVSEAVSGTISKFTQDGTKTTFASNLGEPGGIAFDASGNLFVADFGGGKILKITPAGTTTTFATGLGLPAGLAFDAAGNLFEADSDTGTIFKFAPDGTKTTFVTGLSQPFGLAFEAGGALIVADSDAGTTARYSATGVRTVIFSSEFNTPQFVAIEPATHQLLNISTRGLVQTGDDVLIAGFIVGGTGPLGTSVVVRALGPSLAQAGVANPLQDPVLELRNSSGALIATNNNWQDDQPTKITTLGFTLADDRESGIQTTLPGGAFTAIVRGVNDTTGTAVVEVYNLQ